MVFIIIVESVIEYENKCKSEVVESIYSDRVRFEMYLRKIQELSTDEMNKLSSMRKRILRHILFKHDTRRNMCKRFSRAMSTMYMHLDILQSIGLIVKLNIHLGNRGRPSKYWVFNNKLLIDELKSKSLENRILECIRNTKCGYVDIEILKNEIETTKNAVSTHITEMVKSGIITKEIAVGFKEKSRYSKYIYKENIKE